MRTSQPLLIGTAWLVVASASGAQPLPTATIPALGSGYNVNAQWYGHPPEYKYEWGWTKAPVCKDFIERGGKPPTQKTEVQVLYTPRQICFAATCYNADPKKLSMGVPREDGAHDTELAWMEDVFEIFIQPDPSAGVYYQFGVQPNGAMCDKIFGKRRSGDWNARWQAATKVLPDRWQVEIAIDISSITWAGRLRGTPQRGDRWRITFCRSAGGWGEYSCWSSPKGWHHPDQWGTIVFGPKPPGVSFKNSPVGPDGLVVTEVTPGDPVLGEHTLRAVVRNPAKTAMDLALTIAIADAKRSPLDTPTVKETTQRVRLGPGERRAVSVPYRVLAGRVPHKRLVFTIKRSDRSHPSYYAEARFAIFPLAERLAEMTRLVDAVLAECGHDVHARSPAAKEAIALMGALRSRLTALDASGRTPAERVADAKALRRDLDKARLRYFNRLRARLFAAGAPLVVAPVHATLKVLDNVPFEGTFSRPATMRLARNEYESRQFVLLAAVDDPPEVTVEVTPLAGPDGARIGREQIEVHRVCTVQLTMGDLPIARKRWPDPLLPTNRTSLEPGVPQSMMVTVRAAATQAPGTYRGHVRFKTAGADPVTLPMEVEVFDFTLPQRWTFHNEVWFDPGRAGFYYGDITPEVFEKFVRLAAAYRVSSWPNTAVLTPKVRLVKTADGSLRLDFTDVDPYLKILRRYDVKRVNVSFGCNWRAWYGVFARGLWYYEPGKSQARYQRCDDPWAWYGRYLVEMTRHLQELGWKADELYYVGNDEPGGAKIEAEMRVNYELAAKVIPHIRRSSAGVSPAASRIRDLVEIWCPQIRIYKREHYVGDPRELWLYTCTFKYPPYPCWSTPTKAVATRITHWVCRKVGATGFLYWSMNKWAPKDPTVAARIRSLPHAEKPWVSDRWPHGFWIGDGVLMYPGPDGPVAGLKLAAIRDGTEDYEYMVMLERAAKRARGAPPALVREALELAAVPDRLVTSISQWTEDLDQIEAARTRMARLIVQLARFAR